MFSDPDVIKSSRNFVCIRIESYESKENQDIVRSYLGGRFENTAFCILSPDGKERLTRAGRGPNHVSRDFDDIAKISDNFKAKGNLADSRVPDFNSFDLALNVSSADQKMLLFVAVGKEKYKKIEASLRPLAWDQNFIGKFNYDFESSENNWSEKLSLRRAREGYYLIEPDEYGLSGKVVKALPVDTKIKVLMVTMISANQDYADTTDKKVYSSHVSKGKRLGKTIKMAMPFGEDRDGDGAIDHRAGSRRR